MMDKRQFLHIASCMAQGSWLQLLKNICHSFNRIFFAVNKIKIWLSLLSPPVTLMTVGVCYLWCFSEWRHIFNVLIHFYCIIVHETKIIVNGWAVIVVYHASASPRVWRSAWSSLNLLQPLIILKMSSCSEVKNFIMKVNQCLLPFYTLLLFRLPTQHA